MEIFGTTVTVIHEVYAISVFIRGLITDIKAMESVKNDIRDKLEHEILFLVAFKDLFFDSNDAPMRSDRIHDYLKQDVKIILMSLKRALAEYEAMAAKYGMLPTEPSPETGSQASLPPAFATRIKLKMKDLQKTLGWALFDKDKLLATLAEYSEWTGRLRQTMSLVLMTLASIGKFPLGDKAKAMGLGDVVKRQRLVVSQPPLDFGALGGHIVEGSEVTYGLGTRVAKYEDEWSQSQTGEYLVEYRNYSMELVRAIRFGLPEQESMKEPVRGLAWLLHEASFTDGEEHDPLSNKLALYTLQCLGYIDQPQQNRVALLYRLPKAEYSHTPTSIVTLHEWISTEEVQGGKSVALPKPTLGARFSLAYALCLTVLNTHSSGWIHKNIWSHGVLMFPSSSPAASTSLKYIPYLTGWEVSRPVGAGTELAGNLEAEPNYYRHPIRQGYPKRAFKVEYDIYALGVVLLEIGLWRTVRSIFKTQIEKATAEKRLPPPETIREDLLEQAGNGLPGEMGEVFTNAVEICLSGNFGVRDGEDRAALSASFRELVLDNIARGVKL